MEKENKDVYIRCRVTEKIREDWIKACDKNAQNGSELLRRYIQEYIKKNSSK